MSGSPPRSRRGKKPISTEPCSGSRENTAFLVSQSVSYQKLGGVLYASYSLTYKEQTYFTQEMSFGIRVIPIPALIGIVAGVIVLLALGVWLLRRRRKQKNIG